MNIRLEAADLKEPEVIIRGDIASPEVAQILQTLGKKSCGKLLLYREDEQFPMDPSEIVFLETKGSKVHACTIRDRYESRLKLYELNEQLTSRSFVQINKSTIVNINFVKSIQAEFSGNYCLKLKDRPEVLTISRNYFKAFKERI